MAQDQKTRVNKVVKSAPRGNGYNSLLIIIVSFILIAIPVYMIGRVIYDSYMEAGVPIVGERFEDDLPNKITDQQLDTIETGIRGLSGVEDVEIHLQTATVKIAVDVYYEVTAEDFERYRNEMVSVVNTTLPIESYFTKTDMVKNYDLEIAVYNDPADPTAFAIITKNSGMSEAKLDIVSTPKDPEVTSQVLGQGEVLPEPVPTDEVPTEEPPVETQP